ncbi:MAG TPA: LytTR family DNA-binding domain-containing protein [Cytophagales bacterium]
MKKDVNPSVLDHCIFIADNYRYERIRKTDILFVAANGAYVDIYTAGKRYSLSTNLGNFVSQVQGPELVRVSRSHVVNLHHVESVQGNTIFIQQYTITVSKPFRQHFLSLLPIIRTKAAE